MVISGTTAETILAVTSGILSFVSPCSLPVTLPALALAAANRAEPERNSWWGRICPWWIPGLCAGFLLIFFLMTIPATGPGRWAWDIRGYLRLVGGTAAVLLGLEALGWNGATRALVWLGMQRPGERPGILPATLIGLGLGAAWSPCPGRVLTSLTILAASLDGWGLGWRLLLGYSLGFGVILVLTYLILFHLMAIFPDNWRQTPGLARGGGLLLITLGVILALDLLILLTPRGGGFFSV